MKFAYPFVVVLTSSLSPPGQREFVNMLPLVCNDAVAILFMFDLSRKSTLNSVKEWYRQARGFNKVRTGSNRPSPAEGMPELICIPVPDRYTFSGWNKIRHLFYIPKR